MSDIKRIDWLYFNCNPKDGVMAICRIVIGAQLVKSDNMVVDTELVIPGVRVIREQDHLAVEYVGNSNDSVGIRYTLDDEIPHRWEEQILRSYQTYVGILYKEEK